MKEYKLISCASIDDFNLEIGLLAKANWKPVPNTFQVIYNHAQTSAYKVFQQWERDIPTAPQENL